MRMFGIKSAFDICVTIIFGAVLARDIVSRSPFIPTIVVSTTLVIIHIIGAIVVSNQRISHLVKGIQYSLYKAGQLNDKNLKKSLWSYGDIM